MVRIARGGDGIGKKGELMLNNEAKNNAWPSVLVCHKSDSDRGVWYAFPLS